MRVSKANCNAKAGLIPSDAKNSGYEVLSRTKNNRSEANPAGGTNPAMMLSAKPRAAVFPPRLNASVATDGRIAEKQFVTNLMGTVEIFNLEMAVTESTTEAYGSGDVKISILECRFPKEIHDAVFGYILGDPRDDPRCVNHIYNALYGFPLDDSLTSQRCCQFINNLPVYDSKHVVRVLKTKYLRVGNSDKWYDAPSGGGRGGAGQSVAWSFDIKLDRPMEMDGVAFEFFTPQYVMLVENTLNCDGGPYQSNCSGTNDARTSYHGLQYNIALRYIDN